MGASFSVETLKLKLHTAQLRIDKVSGKLKLQLQKKRRDIATMVADGSSELAQIRTEIVIHDENMLLVLERVKLDCELVAARLELMRSSPDPPPTLLGPVCDILFCAPRTQVAELREIAGLLKLKYGQKWVNEHQENKSSHVSPSIVEWLAISVPRDEDITERLCMIAQEFDVQYEPSAKLGAAPAAPGASEPSIPRGPGFDREPGAQAAREAPPDPLEGLNDLESRLAQLQKRR